MVEQRIPILLYLALITSPGTYPEQTLIDLINANLTEIERIEADQVLYDQIQNDYADEAAAIIIDPRIGG